ncbi:MAG: hypothetical protein IJW20_05930 [Clostridia bacterium]|nr:hypothetical protein [Clostridia bacterium]
MENFDMEALKEPASRYTLTTNSLNDFLDKLKELFVENSNLIMDANKTDIKHNKKQIKVKEFIEIIEKYRKKDCVLKDDERKIVIYRGDPYLTLHICLQAVTQRTKVLLFQQNFMLGVNEILLKIFNEVLEEFKISNLINRVENFSVQSFEKVKNFYDEVIIIGDTTTYQMLNDDNDVKFYPYNNIALYCNSDELEKLQEAIYIYANENEYEIEIIYADDLNEAIELINGDEQKSIAVLLTKTDDDKEKFFYEIKNKEIFVNENPFKKEVGKIYNYLK